MKNVHAHADASSWHTIADKEHSIGWLRSCVHHPPPTDAEERALSDERQDKGGRVRGEGGQGAL